MVSPKEALKAQVAAFQKAMEETTKAVVEAAASAAASAAANAAAEAAAEAALEELGRLCEPMVIEPDKGENKSHDKNAYTAFKESIKVEDHEASYLEAL